MEETFRRVSRLERGYDVEQVDSFFRRAGATDGSAASALPESLTPEQVRLLAFGLTRHGYDVAEVDRALDRLEEAVAARDRDRLLSRRGEQGLLDHRTALSDTLRRRLDRAPGRRFRRGSRLQHTYDPAEVDALCDTLKGYLGDGTQLSVDDIRCAVFRSRRGRRGYREADVDAFLDRAVATMLTVD